MRRVAGSNAGGAARLGLAALLGALSVARLGGTQEPAAPPQQPQPELVIPVGTEVVRVDVIVTDKSGKARAGLRREDFQVLEDGQLQAITQFEAYVSTAAQAAQPAGAPATPAAATPAPGRASPRRFVVLVVDDIHLEAANLIRLRKTLDRFLERELPPEDVVALVTTSGTRSQDFTEDRHTLRLVVARLSLQDRRSRFAGVPQISGYQAEAIERGDLEALMVAVAEILAQRPSANAEAEARQVARAVLAESIASARATFEAVHNVVRSLGALPGRKVVVFVSDGFTSGFGVDSRAALDLRQITDAGTRSGVIVYALDSRGLQPNPSWNASSRVFLGGQVFGARERLTRAEEYATQDAMNAMATDTGGFLVANTNSLSDALQRIVQDTEVYYLLAYEPANATRDGAFRTIEVRLPGLKDVRLRHRKGYFGPGAREPGTRASASPAGSASAPEAASPVETLRGELRGALTSPAALKELPVSMSADFVSLDAGRTTQVVVSGYVDLRDVPFARTSGRRLASVDIAAAVFDAGGEVVGSLAVERAALDLTDEAYEQSLEKGLPYQRVALLEPGRYRVCVAVREESGGKLGSATHWVEIPDLARGDLALSSLFLMKEASSRRTRDAMADGPELRAVQAHRVYRQEESLYVQFLVYNVGDDGSGLVTQTEIWRGGRALAASPPEPLTVAVSSRAHTRRIALGPFAPGDYEVRIVVRDRASSRSVWERASFTIR